MSGDFLVKGKPQDAGGVLAYDECLSLAEPQSLKEAVDLKQWFQDTYGVQVTTPSAPDGWQRGDGYYYHFFPSSLAVQIEQMKNLKQQIQKIPPVFFKSLGIATFVLSGHWMFEDNAQGESRHEDIATAFSSSIYFYEAWPFYHELFHMMDKLHTDELHDSVLFSERGWTQTKKDLEQNSAWALLEPGDSGSTQPDYGDTWVDEEQANYAFILFNLDKPVSRDLYNKQMTNPGKRAKFEQMKRWLLEWSNGVFDNAYWENLTRK